MTSSSPNSSRVAAGDGGCGSRLDNRHWRKGTPSGSNFGQTARRELRCRPGKSLARQGSIDFRQTPLCMQRGRASPVKGTGFVATFAG